MPRNPLLRPASSPQDAWAEERSGGFFSPATWGVQGQGGGSGERAGEGTALLTGKGPHCLLDVLSAEQVCH